LAVVENAFAMLPICNGKRRANANAFMMGLRYTVLICETRPASLCEWNKRIMLSGLYLERAVVSILHAL
jgi:hypothetical protein